MCLSHRSQLSDLARRAWRRLPTAVRSSYWVLRTRAVAAAVRGALSAPVVVPLSQPHPRTLDSIDELDDALKRLDRLAELSDDALRQGFTEFRMRQDPSRLPSDPWSPEYRRAVLDQYEELHGSPYSSDNEITVFDVDEFAKAPFPYSTKSCGTVGHHLIAMGHLIRTLDLPPDSRVLEMGSGWGNVALALAQMGHRVTALDVERRFVDLLRTRAESARVDIDVLHGDFADVRTLDGQFDAVVFFECFHHSSDHLSLLSSLDALVAPGGRMYFAREPIHEDLPVPWGLRLDGESLWAIRRNGWFELGFNRAYFEETLARLGWTVSLVPSTDAPESRVFVAARTSAGGEGTANGDARSSTC